MDRKKKQKYQDVSSTSSATETTGLMQTPPIDEEQFEAYQQLAGMEIPKANGKKHN